MSSRESRADPSRQGRSSSHTPIIVGGALGAVVLLGGLALLLGGSSSSSARRSSSRREFSIPSGPISPAEARRLKSIGIAEFNRGNALYRQAGAFGSPGYAEKCGQARPHLNRAIDCFSKAEEVLRNDRQLTSYSEQCGKILAASFKVPVNVH